MTESYKVFLKKTAEKELRVIRSKDLARVIDKIKHLSQQPRPHGCEKMEGREQYRIRQEDWRIIFSVNDDEKTVMVFKIGNRREVYR